MLQTIAVLNDAARLQAIHSGHVPIHQYELIWVHGVGHSQFPESILARQYGFSPQCESAQRITKDLPRLCIVIHHQNANSRQVRDETLARWMGRSDAEA